MNYLELINRFWLAHEGNLFSCTETALYFYLLKTCNLCGWPDSIKRNNAKIQADLGITYPTLSKARNRLKQTGMIDFKTKAGSCNTSYTFKNILKVSLKDCNEVTTEVSSEVGIEVECEVDSDTSYKGDKDKRLKIKQKSPVSPPKSEDAELPLKISTREIPGKSDVKSVADFFNETCKSLKPVNTLTEKRTAAVSARLREYGRDAVFDTLRAASRSAFLAGQNTRGWMADFDWIFRPGNFVKVMEGKYDNKEKPQQYGTENNRQLNGRLAVPSEYEDF